MRTNFKTRPAYRLQHSYSKAAVQLETKFGQIIHKTKPTYYIAATTRLQQSQSKNLVKLHTRQSLHTTTQLLQSTSGSRAIIWSNYTQDKAYILQHSYSKAPVELEQKFGQIIHKTKPTYYNTATPRLQQSQSQNLVKLYTRQSLHTKTQLLQGSNGTRAKIWSNYTQDKAYILQHSYFKAPVELETKLGEIIHKTKPTYYNTATPRFKQSQSQNLVKLYTRQSLQSTTQLLRGSSRAKAKIWSNYTQHKAYILQPNYSKAPVKLEQKFGQTIHQTKPTYYNTAIPRLRYSQSKNLVKLYTKQIINTTTQLHQGSRGTRAKFGQITHKTKPTYYKLLLQRSSRARNKIWSNYTQDKVYILQHSYSKAPVELEPKFGQMILKTKPTY